MALTLTTRFKFSKLDTLVMRGGHGWGQVSTNGNVCTLTCDQGMKRPPAEIETIREIISLQIQFCTGLDLAATFLMLGKMWSVNRLQLKSCAVKELPPEIGALTNIVDFDLGNEGMGNSNEFKTFPPEFASMKRLRYLRLHHNPQFEAFPPEVAHMTSLRHLGLRGFHSLPRNIELFPNLEDLKLTFGGIVPRHILPLLDRPNRLKSVTVGEAYYDMFQALTAQYPDFSVTQEQTSLRGDY
ncbi:MAG: leucine-rich repeat domain-containing protein [Pyrinomonadaceae bacterium]